MPTFIFINFQLSHELFLICFAEKQNNVEAAVFIENILCCRHASVKSIFSGSGIGPGLIFRSVAVSVFTILKRFCSVGTFLLIVVYSLRSA
jgi:hypothetical protein